MTVNAISPRTATFVGSVSILLLSAVVGLIRGVSVSLGPIGGAAMIYTCSALILLATFGSPKLSSIPRRYLWAGSVLFVAYEVCFSLSLGFAHNSKQTIELGMINYLWPCFTLVLATIVDKPRRLFALIPGLGLSMAGIYLVQSGDGYSGLAEFLANLEQNPLSYTLSFSGAVIWAVYCVATSKMAKGVNGITLFVALTALAMWCHYGLAGAPSMRFNLQGVVLLGFASAAFAIGYATWNVGMLHGNVVMLAAASYFIPILSSAFAGWLLAAVLPVSFWQGAVLVCVGSMACWVATKWP